MEIYERIRELRKKHLKMSMEVFGNRLGVSRDTINNIELNRLARLDQKMSLFKLICSEFNVNEDWLLNGEEPMFIETPSSTMEQLKEEFSLDEFGYNLVYQYLKLDGKQRQAVRDFFYNVVDSGMLEENLYDEVPKTPEELEEIYPPVKRNKKDAG